MTSSSQRQAVRLYKKKKNIYKMERNDLLVENLENFPSFSFISCVRGYFLYICIELVVGRH